MKKILASLLGLLGLTSACGQKLYDDVDVHQFATLMADTSVVVLDVRTSSEFASGHLEGAVNIDVKKDDFLQRAKSVLPVGKTMAVYCRSGRRSANACNQLCAEGYKCVNLKGGIMAWTGDKMPIVKD